MIYVCLNTIRNGTRISRRLKTHRVGNPMNSSPNELKALRSIIDALHPMDAEARQRILESVATFLQIDRQTQRAGGVPSIGPVPRSDVGTDYSDDTSISPKEFVFEKQPRTDVERVACLAFYLTHYRSTPHFKTIDLSKLNTEAAQPKFANTAYSANNAVKLGYLVQAARGQKQLSAVGERFILALPDREAAKTALQSLRRRSKSRKARAKSNVIDQQV